MTGLDGMLYFNMLTTKYLTKVRLFEDDLAIEYFGCLQ